MPGHAKHHAFKPSCWAVTHAVICLSADWLETRCKQGSSAQLATHKQPCISIHCKLSCQLSNARMAGCQRHFVQQLSQTSLAQQKEIGLYVYRSRLATSGVWGSVMARNLTPVRAWKQCKSKVSACSSSMPKQLGTGESCVEMAFTECLPNRQRIVQRLSQ